MPRRTGFAAFALALLVVAPWGCKRDDAPSLTRAELLDPSTCATCHPAHVAEWAGSMHAYAADDPVFLAMNARGQRETNGALGSFCVNCHAPMAVREGATRDGTNLATVPRALKGVTCFFCHSATAVHGTHDNPLELGEAGALRASIADPDRAAPHGAGAWTGLDVGHADSAALCGACHDIVNQHGAAVERTFAEWQGTLFAQPSVGLTCGQCHMTTRPGPASTASAKPRTLHAHDFAGVDTALTEWPNREGQKREIQAQLDATVQASLCVHDDGKIQVVLDNVGAGHGFPSGATPDRRAWVEVVAYANDQVVFQSGVTAAPAAEPSAAGDPYLWLMRDCLYDQQGTEVHMFWQPSEVVPSALPGPIAIDRRDPTTFTKGHIRRVYPGASVAPDRVTMRVRLRAVGEDVLDDLIASGDLDPAVKAQLPTFDLGGTVLEWTPAKGEAVFDAQRQPLSCVGSMKFTDTPNEARSHASCAR